MSTRHVSAASLEAWVIGALDDVEAAVVEAHVASCSTCEARLQQEARLELAFTALAQAEPPRLRKSSVFVGRVTAAGAALAMAAAMIMWIVPRGEVEHPQSSEPPMLTDVSGDASTVTASLELQADGSRVGVRD